MLKTVQTKLSSRVHITDIPWNPEAQCDIYSVNMTDT